MTVRGRASAMALARAGILLSAFFLVSRVLGYVRVVVLAETYGIGAELDTFYAAFRLPDLVYQLVAAGALTSGLVPVLAGLVARGEDERARRITGSLGVLVTLAVGVVAAIAWLLAPWIVPAMTPGFTDAQLAETTDLTRLMLLGPVLLSAGSVATSWLNARDRFTAGAVSPAAYNLGIIAGVWLLAPALGIRAAALGVLAGSALYLVAAWVGVARRGLLPPLRVERDPELGRAFRLMLPRMVGLAGSQLALTVLVAVASGLPEGSVSVLATAQILLQLPLGLIGIPLGIVLLPSLTREIALGNLGEYRRLAREGLRALLLVMVGVAAVGIALAVPVVTLLFPGSADDGTVRAIAETLRIFLIGLPAHGAIAVLGRACYARSDTRSPVIFALVAVVIDIALALVLAPQLGVPGIAAAVAIGAWVEAAGIALVLRRAAGLDVAGILAPFPAILLSAGAAGAVAALIALLMDGLARGWVGNLVLLAVAGLAGIAVHFAAAALLRVREVGLVVGIVRARAGRRLPARLGGSRP